MTNHQDQIDRLIARLDTLLKKHDDFSREISMLRLEIDKLKAGETIQEAPSGEAIPEKREVKTELEIPAEQKAAAIDTPAQAEQRAPREKPIPTPDKQRPATKSDLEKFIGENLINKIGIVITIIGVAIGAKYAIDNQLISPLTRIILGYLVGLGLLGFALKLKTKYENFSAVLLSGSMAILYFITYAAYSFYGLFPQAIAFVLMVVFTAFTVAAAIHYNQQVIAHIGLVGAYAVPLLLSEGSGKVAILFSYMAIINVGILVISFKKYWKSLYYAAFGLTWLMYLLWFASSYQPDRYFSVALIFLTLFFLIFYLTFLAYKLIRSEKFEGSDIVLLLANAFLFYGLGFFILSGNATGSELLGAFTLSNAVIHFIVSALIYRQKTTDPNLFYLIAGLVLVFITVAIPVQLDGNWVTLLWVGEAALMFWIGRTKKVPVYEKLAYPLMVLAFFSLLQDWMVGYGSYSPNLPETRITPFLNIYFLTSILFIATFGYINVLNRNEKYPSTLTSQRGIAKIFSYSIPAILLFTLFFAFRMEIANYWSQLSIDSALTITTEGQQYSNYYHNADLNRFKTIWILNYSLLFFSILAFVNLKKLKSRQLGLINLILIAFTLLVFLGQGLYVLSELRESYLEQTLAEYYHRGVFNIGIRYISFAFVALALIAGYRYVREEFTRKFFRVAFDFALHITVLWVASSELIHWIDISGSAQTYKLGLSILWGVYSLFLIALGIWKKKKHLRIGAIVLFGITLLKLVTYDIAHLDTIARTIVFVSLGVLLLIISFLYNKYKHIISDEAVD